MNRSPTPARDLVHREKGEGGVLKIYWDEPPSKKKTLPNKNRREREAEMFFVFFKSMQQVSLKKKPARIETQILSQSTRPIMAVERADGHETQFKKKALSSHGLEVKCKHHLSLLFFLSL